MFLQNHYWHFVCETVLVVRYWSLQSEIKNQVRWMVVCWVLCNSPGFHARLDFHRFIRARHHSHKHLSGLRVVLSLQVFIHTVFNVGSQSCWLQPYNEHKKGRAWKFKMCNQKNNVVITQSCFLQPVLLKLQFKTSIWKLKYSMKNQLTFCSELVFFPCFCALLQTVLTDESGRERDKYLSDSSRIKNFSPVRQVEQVTHPDGQMTS